MASAVDVHTPHEARDDAKHPALTAEIVACLSSFIQSDPMPDIYVFNLVLSTLMTCAPDVLLPIAEETISRALQHPAAMALIDSVGAFVRGLGKGKDALAVLLSLVLSQWEKVSSNISSMVLLQSIAKGIKVSITKIAKENDGDDDDDDDKSKTTPTIFED